VFVISKELLGSGTGYDLVRRGVTGPRVTARTGGTISTLRATSGHGRGRQAVSSPPPDRRLRRPWAAAPNALTNPPRIGQPWYLIGAECA